MEINLFYQHAQQKVVDAPKANRNGLTYAAEHPAQFGLDPSAIPAGFDKFNADHKKLMANLLHAAGWSYVLGFPHFSLGYYVSIEPVSLSQLSTVLQHVQQHCALPELKQLSVDSIEAGILTFEAAQLEQLRSTGTIADTVFLPVCERNRKFNTLLEQLETQSFAERATVFGSAARGKPFPGDIDLWVDLRGVPEATLVATPLLQLARNYYGAFDPFIHTDDGVFVRNSAATGWTKARAAKTLARAVATHGKALSTLPPLAVTADAWRATTQVTELTCQP